MVEPSQVTVHLLIKQFYTVNMSIAIICPEKDTRKWVENLKELQPNLNISVYPDIERPEEIEYAICWKHPRGVFKNFPNLKVIASMGAGVDHITHDPEIPEHVSITRVVDEQLTNDMGTFVLGLVTNKIRNISFHHNNPIWKPISYKKTQEESVGIMGLGILGKSVAETLEKNGFLVSGWSKTHKKIAGVKTHFGEKGLDNFLKETSLLICLLPLTSETENILKKELFAKLPIGSYIINVARGEHLVEHDLLEMLDKDHLSGASLDVFRTEPLPPEHPFWKHSKIQITPHIASVTDPKTAVIQLVENYNRMKHNRELLNKVSLKKGY